MKLFVLSIFFYFSTFESNSKAQSVSCNDLSDAVTQFYDYKDNVNYIYNSTLLRKITFYEAKDMGFVIAYIKSNEYDYYGKPYVFCDISRQRWNTFKIDGLYGSWGEAFHKYIIDYTCDCD